MAPIPPNTFQGRPRAKKGRVNAGQENTFARNAEKDAPTVNSMFAAKNDNAAPRITKATILPPVVISKERITSNNLNRPKLSNAPQASHPSTLVTAATGYKGFKGSNISRIPRPPLGAPIDRRPALTDITQHAHTNTRTRLGTPPPEEIKMVLVTEKGYLAAKEVHFGQHSEAVPEAMDTHMDQGMKRLSLEGEFVDTTRVPLQNSLNVKEKHSPQPQNQTYDVKASTTTLSTGTTTEDTSIKMSSKRPFPGNDQSDEKPTIPSNNQLDASNTGDVDMDERSNGSTIFPRRLMTEAEYFLMEDYADRIFQYMKENEVSLRISRAYVESHNVQFWNGRMTAVDSICNYGNVIRASLECTFLAVNLMDRVLTKDGLGINETRIVVVGTLCLLIAAKYEDGVRPLMDLMTVSEILDSRGVHVDLDAIRQMEWRILKSLDFQLAWPGPLLFLRRCSRADDENPEARMMAKYFLELMLYDRCFLIYVPSHQAAAALYVSRLFLSHSDWNGLLVEYSGYQESQLRSASLRLLEFLNSDIIQRTTVFTKYSVRECYRVSVFVAHWARDIFQLLANQ
ncbi:MAG: cyclin-like protein [Podila humilis]|nr:MAG: cyclin-like protein [Podila humilis]